MNIIDYIGIGIENAVSRTRLCELTGYCDRKVRLMIAEAKQQAIIASTNDGRGYYIPTIADYDAAKEYQMAERAKAKDIFYGVKNLTAWLDDVEHGRIKE